MPEITAGALTASGNPLPIASLSQKDGLLTHNVNDQPLLKDALGPGVSFKPLRLDLDGGCWVVEATFAPGAELPIHYHTGPAEVWTLSGKWAYREYPDEPQTAGSYLYEPGGSVHTFTVPADNTEDTVIIVRAEGANINFDEAGSFHSILDAVTIYWLTGQLAAAAGETVEFILGDEQESVRAG